MRIGLILSCILLFNSSFAQKSNAVLKAIFSDNLKESSGIIVNKYGVFSFNDGVSNSIYKIDTITGNILQEIKISNATFTDAEAITSDEEYLYIGDFGNNAGRRDNLNIIKINLKSLYDTVKTISIKGEFIKFNYEDMVSYPVSKEENNFDCEAMVCSKNEIILFTKRRGDNTTTMYSLPKEPGSYKAKPITSFNCFGLITDAALSPDGSSLLLLGYEKGHKESFIWQFNNFNNSIFSDKNAKLIKLNESYDEWQTEGICFLTNNRVFITCEKAGKYNSGLYTLKIN